MANLESRRHAIVYQLVMVLTLLFLATFLWVYFVVQNFAVPCSENQGTGSVGKIGATGSPGKDSTRTGATGLAPMSIGPRGPQGPPGENLTGPTSAPPPSTGLGFVGPQGPTGETGQFSFDALVTPGLIFLTSAPSLLSFYEEIQITATVSANPILTPNTTTTQVVLTRMGGIVTMNVYPFMLYALSTPTPGGQGILIISIFGPDQPLPAYAPRNVMQFPIIVTQAGGDTGGLLQVQTGNTGGCFIFANFTMFGKFNLFSNNPGPANLQATSFTVAGSPWGLTDVASVSWTV